MNKHNLKVGQSVFIHRPKTNKKAHYFPLMPALIEKIGKKHFKIEGRNENFSLDDLFEVSDTTYLHKVWIERKDFECYALRSSNIDAIHGMYCKMTFYTKTNESIQELHDALKKFNESLPIA